MPTIRQVWQLIHQGDDFFSKVFYLHSPIAKHDCHIFHFVWQDKLISGRSGHLSWPQILGFLLFLLNLYCFFASAKAFVLLFTWAVFLVLIHSKLAGKMTCSFLLFIVSS